MEGDDEAPYVHYALHKLRIRPSEFVTMDEQEKAFIFASIIIKAKQDKEQEREVKRNANRKR